MKPKDSNGSFQKSSDNIKLLGVYYPCVHISIISKWTKYMGQQLAILDISTVDKIAPRAVPIWSAIPTALDAASR